MKNYLAVCFSFYQELSWRIRKFLFANMTGPSYMKTSNIKWGVCACAQ